MSDEPEIPLILGIPFGAPGYTPGPDFQLAPCPECHNSMWLGPRQREKIKEGIGSICVLCLAKKQHPKDTLFRLHHLGGESGTIH